MYSDDDSDFDSRQRSYKDRDTGSKSYSSSYGSSSRNNFNSRDNDRYETKGASSSSRYSNSDSYRGGSSSRHDEKYSNKFSDDSDDNPVNNRYGATSRRNMRQSDDSDDSDYKNDRYRRSQNARPLSSMSRKDNHADIESYESANVNFINLYIFFLIKAWSNECIVN